ncbi:MAG: fimbrillin family protein [Bacteroidales bacterium]|nr:fimbrillin family protein [Bacteroidales bacterium]
MKKYITIIASLAALVSCQKEGPADVPGDNQIVFEFGLPSTKATAENFEAGDNVSVWAVEYTAEQAPELQIGGNFLNNEKLSFDGALWTGKRPLYWSEKQCDFYAVYPYIQPTSVESYLFEIATDQNAPATETSLGGFEASDLLVAKAEAVSREDGKVSLKFRHTMSKCVVNVVKGEKFEGELPEDIAVHIYNTVTTADLNLANGSVEKYALGNRNTITMKKLATDKFEAVVIPQNIERRTPLIEISMGGIAYLLEYSLSFKPGYAHTINLTVNTSPDQEKFEISIDASTGDMN